MKITSIMLDEETKNMLESYASQHAISRSSAIRAILRDFLMKGITKTPNERKNHE